MNKHLLTLYTVLLLTLFSLGQFVVQVGQGSIDTGILQKYNVTFVTQDSFENDITMLLCNILFT